MCGVLGFVQGPEGDWSSDNLSNGLKRIKHRGPDASEFFVEDTSQIGLGHVRLSIIDLTAAANQPFTSTCGNYTIVFNGEIYNYLELRARLITQNISFRTRSDTEVLLEYYMAFGKEGFCDLNGMFAFAIYDRRRKELILARDRFGVKPLYYYSGNSGFVFCSEIKGIYEFIGDNCILNSAALIEFLWFGNSLGKKTFDSRIFEIEQGQVMTISTKTLEIVKEQIVSKGYNYQSYTSSKQTQVEVRDRLERSVNLQNRADVSLALLLSGGLDSGAILSFSNKKLDTFSISFDEKNNELQLARETAQMFSSNHREIFISDNNLSLVMNKLDYYFDQPFADAANVPLYQITKRLSETHKVILQGDGGDELFGGYTRYQTILLVHYLRPIFFGFNGIIKLFRIPVNTRLRRFLLISEQKTIPRMHAALMTIEPADFNPFEVLNERLYLNKPKQPHYAVYEEIHAKYKHVKSIRQRILLVDFSIILKDTFFEKVDKSTMANSVEVRVPFIDNDLVEYVQSIPAFKKLSVFKSKKILRKVLINHLPKSVIKGSKKGFGVPYGHWLTGDLQKHFHSLIDKPKSAELLNIDYVKSLYRKHLAGDYSRSFLLWKIYVLLIWFNRRNVTIE